MLSSAIEATAQNKACNLTRGIANRTETFTEVLQVASAARWSVAVGSMAQSLVCFAFTALFLLVACASDGKPDATCIQLVHL